MPISSCGFSSVMVTNNYCAFCHTLLWNYGFMGQHKVPFESNVDGLKLAMKSRMTIWQPGFKNERKEIVATLCNMHWERVKFWNFIVHTEYREGNSTLTICFCRMFVTGNIRTLGMIWWSLVNERKSLYMPKGPKVYTLDLISTYASS